MVDLSTTQTSNQTTSNSESNLLDLKSDIRIPQWRRLIGYVGQEPVLFDLSVKENLLYGLLERERRLISDDEIKKVCKKCNVDFVDFDAKSPSDDTLTKDANNNTTDISLEEIVIDYDSDENIKPNGPGVTVTDPDDSIPVKLSIHEPIGAKAQRISGGQKQRLAIARALLRRPKILLLDEATSALDAKSEQEVQQTLDAVAGGGKNNSSSDSGPGESDIDPETRDRITITIAHRLSTIRHCDVIFVLVSGKKVEQGNHDELMQKKGVYFRLVQSGAGDPKH